MYVCMYIVVVLVPDFRLPACRSACMSANILRFLVFLCVFKKANIQHLIFSFFTRFVCKVFQMVSINNSTTQQPLNYINIRASVY